MSDRLPEVPAREVPPPPAVVPPLRVPERGAAPPRSTLLSLLLAILTLGLYLLLRILGRDRERPQLPGARGALPGKPKPSDRG